MLWLLSILTAQKLLIALDVFLPSLAYVVVLGANDFLKRSLYSIDNLGYFEGSWGSEVTQMILFIWKFARLDNNTRKQQTGCDEW